MNCSLYSLSHLSTKQTTPRYPKVSLKFRSRTGHCLLVSCIEPRLDICLVPQSPPVLKGWKWWNNQPFPIERFGISPIETTIYKWLALGFLVEECFKVSSLGIWKILNPSEMEEYIRMLPKANGLPLCLWLFYMSTRLYAMYHKEP